MIRPLYGRVVAGVLGAAVVAVALAGCTAAPAPAAQGDCTGASSRAVSSVAYAALPRAASFTQAAAAAGGKAVTLPATTMGFDDFVPADGTVDGAVVGPRTTGLIGAGTGHTVLEVAPSTSTHAADVPTAAPQTNQLSVLRVTGTATLLRGFTVQGTDQGHLYNGLRIDRLHGLIASDLRVDAIPGDAPFPPGETFGINDYRTVGSRWSHVLVDGGGVGASGFGVNDSHDIEICDTTSRNNRFGMGFAFWQTDGVRLVDCTAVGNGRAGFNFERARGTNVLIRPVASGNAYGLRISSDVSSARFRIVDPKLTDGRFTVTLPLRYNHVVNQQKRSDITLIVKGKQRNDLLRFQTY